MLPWPCVLSPPIVLFAAPSAMSTPSLVSNVLVPSAARPMYEPSTTLLLEREPVITTWGASVEPPFAPRTTRCAAVVPPIRLAALSVMRMPELSLPA